MKSFATLRELTQRKEKDLGATFHKMAEFLSTSDERGLIDFSIHSQSHRSHWSLELSDTGPTVSTDKVEDPNLEIITRAETWWEIAEGSLSPVEAFVKGKLRIRGDVELAKRLLKHLSDSEESLDIC